MNYDKEVPQEKCFERKKASVKIHLLIQVAERLLVQVLELWEKCQSDLCHIGLIIGSDTERRVNNDRK
jgi:hypothetical protein